jgi:hydrogenase expression/formation protein HypC
MCLAIPMRITAVDGFSARCEAKGATRDISLFMMQDDLPVVGDYVMVQVGYAVLKVDEAEALKSWELFEQILAETGR